nr:spermatogenesis-associated protein 6 isoform X2 [Zootoca vivipara]
MSPSKGFLCVLELQIRSITCPGVTLKAKDDLYISARILGQYKKTSSVRAIFPLLFNEKLIFEKVYTDVVDPGDLVELFERDTAVLELIQTVPPVGEILATYEANTRDFLFPAPKSITGQRGSVREILMKKAFGFTGIAPKLKFFTSCLISENLLRSEKAQKQDHLNQQQCSSKDGTPHIRSPKKNPPSLERNRQCLAAKTYDQPTVASLSRSPSPYTKRRMCELQQLRQRLAHLDLGPFDFRKESDRPPFVVRRPEQPSAWCRSKDNIKDAWPETTYDPTLLGSYRPKNRKATRFHSGWSATVNGEEIHKRVRNILRTHSARQRLTFDESCLSKDDSVKTRDSSKTEDSNKKRDISDRVRLSHSDFQSSSSIRQSIMVQLDDDDYWTSQSAEYKSKPHRAIFEDSLQKIYRNMYRKASGSKSKNK